MPPPDFYATMARFWQLQVPITLLPDPSGVGLLGLAPYGERVHFTDQSEVEFFLLGYRLGEQTATTPDLPPYMQPDTQEPDQGDEGD